MKPSAETETPEQLVWMHNWTVDADWLHIATEKTIRAYVPHELIAQGIHFAWTILNPEGAPLLYSSVKLGVWLSDANIKLVCAKLGVEMPTRPHGSGKNGNIIKIDIAIALVKHMFPNDDVEEWKRMAAALTWHSPHKLGDKEQDILEMVGELDEENKECPEFKRIAHLAKQKLKEMEKVATRKEVRAEVQAEVRKEMNEEERKRKAETMVDEAALGEQGKSLERAEPASATTRRPGETPPELKDFLTGKMTAHKISITRHAVYGYRAFYPGVVLPNCLLGLGWVSLGSNLCLKTCSNL